MDSLASLNIIPFLGLMNILEVKYLHMPEVYRTMLAILCDYNPLFQSNIIRTRRYLKVLLAREPDLAQCLLNFMDEPQENTQTSTHSGAAGSRSPSSDANRDSPPKPTRSATLVYPELELQTRSTLAGSPPSSVPVQHIADPCQSSDKTDVDASAIAADYKGCLINIETMSGAAVKATDFPLNIFQMNVAAKTSSSPTVTSAAGSHHGDPLKSQPPPPSYGADRMPHFVPVINIHHRGVVLASGEDTAIAGNSACPSAASAEPLPPPPQSPAPDSVPLFLPRLLSSPIVPAAVPAGGVGLAGQQALLPAAGGVAASAAMSDAEQRSSTTAAAAALALQQLGSQVPAQTDSVAALSSASAKSRPSLKSGRKCRVAQTQTSATDLPTVSSKAHGAVTAARETPNTVRTPSVLQTTTINTTTTTTNSNTTNTSLTKNTLSVPTTTTTTTASSQASSTSTPNMCLSKLLGQPSVSYHLPAGQFIDNRNCIVGGGGGGGGGGRPKPASASAEKEGLYGSAGAMSVGGKVSSAAAKLRLLSTQAGGDNKAAGSTRRAGYGGGAGLKAATTTVTAKLGSLSVQTPAAEQRREIRSTTTTTTVLKFSSCSPSSSSSKSGESGASKTLALSKILPVPKLVAAAAAAAASTTPGQKADTVSFDKQVQVGQRQVSKKPKTPAAHSSRQPGGQASSGSRQHVQEPPWNPRRDWQKSSAAKHQQQQQGAETEPPASRDEGRDSQVVGQRAHKNQSTRQQETTTKLPRPGQYQESQKPPLTTVTLSGGGGSR